MPVPTPEEMQYALGIHPTQIAANQGGVYGDPDNDGQGDDQTQQPQTQTQRPVAQQRQTGEVVDLIPRHQNLIPRNDGPASLTLAGKVGEQPAPEQTATPATIASPSSRQSRGLDVPPVGTPGPIPGTSVAGGPDSTGNIPLGRSEDVGPVGGVPGTGPGDVSSLGDLFTKPIAPMSSSQGRIQSDQATLDRDTASGAGIDNFRKKHHIWGNILKPLEVAGSIISPGAMALVPGTTLHHQVQLGQDRANLNADIQTDAQQVQVQNSRLEQQKLLRDLADSKLDKHIDTFDDDSGQRTIVFQKPNGQTYTKAFGSVQGKPGTEPFNAQTLGSLNRQLANRWQVLNPGKPLPQEYTLGQGAAQKDFDRTDKALEQLEKATGTRAQQDLTRQMQTETRRTARSDKSYQFNSTQLERVAAPIDQMVSRVSRLKDTIAQGSPQADALVAPELLTVMAGGQGSGLRMNEAEIARIVGGRSKWQSLQAAINQWRLDPSKANSITPEQREQIRNLIAAVDGKLSMKQQALDQARNSLYSSSDPDEHRRILANARNRMSQIDQGSSNGLAGDIQPGESVADGPGGHQIVFRQGKWVDPTDGAEIKGK